MVSEPGESNAIAKLNRYAAPKEDEQLPTALPIATKIGKTEPAKS
jgi:hypothetical protein